ncbi:MAG: type II toxin-antitoxin system VapC family toxin [Chromatiaceae bacterium]|jgi:predicted nucleic-acid-binding protein
MIAVDTNVLVRILVDDPGQPAQVSAARALAGEAADLHVPMIVLVETVWVLETSYRLPKSAVLRALEHITSNDAFELENPARCALALRLYRDANADFSDCLILAGCLERGLVLHTFDRRLGKLAGASPISPSSQG